MQESRCGFALDSCQAGCLGQPWGLSRRKSKASGQMPRVLERCQKGGGFSHIKATTVKKRPSVGAGGRLKEPVKPPRTESTLSDTKPPKHKGTIIFAKKSYPDFLISSPSSTSNMALSQPQEKRKLASLFPVAGF